MSGEVCGWEHEYDDRTCARPAGHRQQNDGWGGHVHRAADGYVWIHHEELDDGTRDGYLETWDEPWDPLNGPPPTDEAGR